MFEMYSESVQLGRPLSGVIFEPRIDNGDSGRHDTPLAIKGAKDKEFGSVTNEYLNIAQQSPSRVRIVTIKTRVVSGLADYKPNCLMPKSYASI